MIKFNSTTNNILKLKANNINESFIIAIDGPSAAGKGTIAKMLAKALTMQHYASSFFYRRLASLILYHNIAADNISQIIALSADSLQLDSYTAANLYAEEVTNLTSKIAIIAEVRLNLRRPQRLLIEKNKRLILDGRDIGTVIAPDADLKLFITASNEARARRRYLQLTKNNIICTYEEIYTSLIERDQRDEQRQNSPSKPANDAVIIDSSNMDAQAVYQQIIDYINH